MEKQKKGISSTNQDFRKFDQVNKEHQYRLVEDHQSDLFDEDYQIPVCDMGAWLDGNEKDRSKFSQNLGSALEGIGFAVLKNHGIDNNLYNQAYELIRQIFEEIPLAKRLEYQAQRYGSINQGYFPIKQTTNIHPDLVEGWVFCRRAFNLDDDTSFDEEAYWPAKGLEPVFRQVVEANERLILPIMQSILSYFNSDAHLYDQRLTNTNIGLRFNYYPPIRPEDDESGAGRMLGHEDVDLFTLLPAQEVEGLQVYNQENGKWIRLNPPPGTIILNTGDYMQRITNDRLPSTTHRVSKPKEVALISKARISMPMAIYVWEKEILEVLPGIGKPKYKPISAIQFHTKTTSKYYGEDYAVED